MWYLGAEVAYPPGLRIPTCETCGAEWVDGEINDALGEAFEQQRVEKLHAKARTGDINFCESSFVRSDALPTEKVSSPPLIPILKAHGLSIDQVSAPKQTETTQRWKVALTMSGWATPIRTRLEFSRRGASSAVAFEPIDGEIARAYGVTPPLAHHYTDAEAVRQKIYALAGRTETQARDVFDLHLLFARRRLEVLREDALKDMARQAIERAMSLSFDEYAGQVVAFLVPEHADLYRFASAS